jgi:hypothetical protein
MQVPNVEILNNTAAHCSSAELKLSSPTNVTVLNNTFFDNTFRQLYYWEQRKLISNLTLSIA